MKHHGRHQSIEELLNALTGHDNNHLDTPDHSDNVNDDSKVDATPNSGSHVQVGYDEQAISTGIMVSTSTTSERGTFNGIPVNIIRTKTTKKGIDGNGSTLTEISERIEPIEDKPDGEEVIVLTNTGEEVSTDQSTEEETTEEESPEQETTEETPEAEPTSEEVTSEDEDQASPNLQGAEANQEAFTPPVDDDIDPETGMPRVIKLPLITDKLPDKIDRPLYKVEEVNAARDEFLKILDPYNHYYKYMFKQTEEEKKKIDFDAMTQEEKDEYTDDEIRKANFRLIRQSESIFRATLQARIEAGGEDGRLAQEKQTLLNEQARRTQTEDYLKKKDGYFKEAKEAKEKRDRGECTEI